MSRIKSILMFILLMVFAVSYGKSFAVPDPTAAIVEAVTHASDNITENIRAGRHLGFDTYAYPGDKAMIAWRDDSVPFEWVGYYLPSAPCHKGESWSGKREVLADMGWGLAVIYVGQQIWSGKSSRRTAGASCSTSFVTAARGRRDADDAIARASREGFPPGTVVFLDIERMDNTPKSMRDYYSAWTRRMLDAGVYRPGYYVHTHNASLIYRDIARIFIDAGKLDQPPFWIASGKGFSEDKEPHEVGHDFAGVWQGILDVVQTHNGVKLPIDVNVAAVPSPSFTEFAGAE